jgi:hypothetical protein
MVIFDDQISLSPYRASTSTRDQSGVTRPV